MLRDASHASCVARKKVSKRFQLRPVMRAKHHASVGTLTEGNTQEGLQNLVLRIYKKRFTE